MVKSLITGPGQALELPFKPFTLGEVQALSGCSYPQLDHWVKTVILLQHGCGTVGLEYMQAFGVFCGTKYLGEGASQERAMGVVAYVASMTLEHMVGELEAGRTFPVPRCVDPSMPPTIPGIMIKAPKGVLGTRLNLLTLYQEFRSQIAKVFPK